MCGADVLLFLAKWPEFGDIVPPSRQGRDTTKKNPAGAMLRSHDMALNWLDYCSLGHLVTYGGVRRIRQDLIGGCGLGPKPADTLWR